MASQEGSEPETDSPDIYAYVKDLVSPGVRTRLWDRVDAEHEGCVLLRGLHVVPQACLGESQQLWVSGCVCVLSTRERPSSARPASPLLPLTAPPHRGSFPPSSHSFSSAHLFPSSSLPCPRALPSAPPRSPVPSTLSLAPAWQGAPLPGCRRPPRPSPAGRRILLQTPPCCTPPAPGAGPRAGAAAGWWHPLGSFAGSPLRIAGPLGKLLRSWRRWQLRRGTGLAEPPLCPAADGSRHPGDAVSLCTACPPTAALAVGRHPPSLSPLLRTKDRGKEQLLHVPVPSCVPGTAAAPSLSSLAWGSAQPPLARHGVKQQLHVHEQIAGGDLSDGADTRPLCPCRSAPLCRGNRVNNPKVRRSQRHCLTREPPASGDLGSLGSCCRDTLQGYGPWPGQPHCAPSRVSDTSRLVRWVCEAAGGKQLTWVEEKPPLGFCWPLIHLAIRDAKESSSWEGAGCAVR